jgi:hypothetical protein
MTLKAKECLERARIQTRRKTSHCGISALQRRNKREGHDFSRAEKRWKLSPALAAEVGLEGRNIEPVLC